MRLFKYDGSKVCKYEFSQIKYNSHAKLTIYVRNQLGKKAALLSNKSKMKLLKS